jgi:protein involved in polysaccharide export with SLBB domain
MQPARLGALLRSVAFGTLLGMLVLAPSARAQTDLQTPQQANERIRTLSSALTAPPHDYVIGPGDVLSVEVFEVPELSRQVRVGQTGSIALPLVPVRLQMAGLTELQAAQKIAEVLEANGLISHPQVIVSVKERKSNPITVVGAVSHPMVYEADGPTTLLQVLATAGGIASDAGDKVIITRPEPVLFQQTSSPESRSTEPASSEPRTTEPPKIGPEDVVPVSNHLTPNSSSQLSSSEKSSGFQDPEGSAPSQSSAFGAQQAPGNTLTVNLSELIESGDTRDNIPLYGGDIVTVPHAGIVYVLGAVARPGGFVALNDRAQLTTLKVLALAGGLSSTAKKDHAVIIRKDSSGQQHEVPVDLAKIIDRREEDVRLYPSDILYVPTSNTKTALMRAAQIGLAVGTALAIYRVAY